MDAIWCPAEGVEDVFEFSTLRDEYRDTLA